jgi:hypothetical protein
MPERRIPGIYLCVESDWPVPLQEEHGRAARRLHDAVAGQDWITEIAAASGGVGGGPRSIWIFRLNDYAALDRLLRHKEDEVAVAYQSFFSQMPLVIDKVREEVVFL